jgi:hypothetical protein
MPKLSQSDIRAKADEWATLGTKIQKLESVRDEEVEPHRQKFLKACDEVNAAHDPKIEKLQAKRNELYSEVIDWLNAQGKTISLEGDKAIAVVEAKVGSRVINPQKYLAKAKEKGEAMWSAVNIVIKEAEKLLGKKTIDEISTKDSKLVASIKLK